MQQEKKELLIEIGVEELPVRYIKPALESWLNFIAGRLFELNLHPSAAAEGEAKKYSTPRRLTLHIKDISVKQDDKTVEKTGPAVRVAFDEKGELSKAGKGFLRGATIDSLSLNLEQIEKNNKDEINLPYLKDTKKGTYLAVKNRITGKPASELLADVCKESLSKINFPKMMRWKLKNFRFARPVRWILALFGDDILEFEAAGVKTGRITYGNIFEKKAPQVMIEKIDDYLSLLEKNLVIADREKRHDKIHEQIEKLTDKVNGRVSDPGLLEEVTDIVEYPTAVLAEFEERYLILPPRVIRSTLAVNQRYFPIYNKYGKPVQNFIYIANNRPEYAENTREGNEKVVKARLADAEYYYEEDKAKSIDFFNKKLEGIIFHAKLGTVWEKVERIVKISEYLCESLAVDEKTKKKVLRAAGICKFDLATSMIGEKEFTGLQGYMGKVYSLQWGEDEEVADAAEDHYLPVGLGLTEKLKEVIEREYGIEKNEEIPADIIGRIVSLADKVDTLCGFFGINIIPTGSKDQYALRRAGNSVVKLIYEAKLSINLKNLIDYVFLLLSNKLPGKNNKRDTLWEFFKQRIKQYLQHLGISYDIADAVLAVEDDDILKVVNRAKALQTFRAKEDFELLLLSFKRVTNIIAAEKNSATDSSKFCEDAEWELYNAIKHAEKKVSAFRTDNDYRRILEEFVGLNKVIDRFFDNVLVNVEDDYIRRNRYALLNMLRNLFLNIGDLSLIVIDGC